MSELLLTCESVLTEAAYLLNSVPLVLNVLTSGLVELSFSLEDNRAHLSGLAARNAVPQPDRRDFAICKRNKRQTTPLIPPP